MSESRITLGVIAAAALFVALFVGVLVSSEPQEEAQSRLLASPQLTYNPVTAGDELPAGFRQLLDRDQIAPIYNPEFTTPANVDWPDEMLVIGLAIDDAAKAYPVTPLNQREMVIDSLEGIPVLVTW